MNKKGFVGLELLIGLIVLSIIIAGVVVVNNARLNQDISETPTPTQIENNNLEISPTPESTLTPPITPEPTNNPTPQPKADPPLAETTKPTSTSLQSPTVTPTTPSATSQPPTSTPIAPSSTPTITSTTSTLTPTHTPTTQPSSTPIPTNEPTATPTNTPVPTPVPSPTPTPIPTNTPTPTATTTPTPVCIPTLCPVRPNAIQVCLTGGVCGFTCNAYYGDCDSAAANGCELNIGNNVNNCGSCGHVCTLPHATNGCSQGSCFIQSCDIGWADCNHNPSDGCECFPD